MVDKSSSPKHPEQSDPGKKSDSDQKNVDKSSKSGKPPFDEPVDMPEDKAQAIESVDPFKTGAPGVKDAVNKPDEVEKFKPNEPPNKDQVIIAEVPETTPSVSDRELAVSGVPDAPDSPLRTQVEDIQRNEERVKARADELQSDPTEPGPPEFVASPNYTAMAEEINAKLYDDVVGKGYDYWHAAQVLRFASKILGNYWTRRRDELDTLPAGKRSKNAEIDVERAAARYELAVKPGEEAPERTDFSENQKAAEEAAEKIIADDRRERERHVKGEYRSL